MIVKHVAVGPVSDYALDGSVLTVAGVAIDLAARQADVTAMVDLTADHNGVVAEGLAGSYVASVVIPPRQHRFVDSGELGFDDQPVMSRQALPLNVAAVQLFLWPMENNPTQGE
ncbi:MAG: hypothetical protein J7K75_08390 [Desulfuromonas sp.]|nr:hypothetical protein [Desulfuromonas sp.]